MAHLLPPNPPGVPGCVGLPLGSSLLGVILGDEWGDAFLILLKDHSSTPVETRGSQVPPSFVGAGGQPGRCAWLGALTDDHGVCALG